MSAQMPLSSMRTWKEIKIKIKFYFLRPHGQVPRGRRQVCADAIFFLIFPIRADGCRVRVDASPSTWTRDFIYFYSCPCRRMSRSRGRGFTVRGVIADGQWRPDDGRGRLDKMVVRTVFFTVGCPF
jgi:hypothetical protein